MTGVCGVSLFGQTRAPFLGLIDRSADIDHEKANVSNRDRVCNANDIARRVGDMKGSEIIGFHHAVKDFEERILITLVLLILTYTEVNLRHV